ncbi:hypothetical protein P872_04315 [Rhodonellum psychrophilum GCM71 = DSM 17998]|uniref:Rrf2 family transcriptional regulator n=2 Tax=Rhodonellum TaxID=336827 RepID=U5C3G6_9BACT|nr:MULTISPECIES: Rrf2 family transcriptional regulator [Rhodonellum]ERM82747.1 hypothetical protein P872_04315 [Rhodonellum psychrophilum GCM71 = DSM 17998]SDZ28735.1 transcriptional regulator, BadM/Rrf2 family [Rhodonellum ikkaensis]
MFSKACKYAINAMTYIATLPKERDRVGLKEISKEINSPEAFTAKILQVLVKDHLLTSIKGPNGGFMMRGKSEEIFLGQIVEAIDGDVLFTGCALGLEHCNGHHPCAVHHKFKAIRDHLAGMLMTTSLKEVAFGINNGTNFLRS